MGWGYVGWGSAPSLKALVSTQVAAAPLPLAGEGFKRCVDTNALKGRERVVRVLKVVTLGPA